jgi:hypothetical protein
LERSFQIGLVFWQNITPWRSHRIQWSYSKPPHLIQVRRLFVAFAGDSCIARKEPTGFTPVGSLL